MRTSKRLRAPLGKIGGAKITPFQPPAIRGVGSVGGFQFILQDTSAGRSLQELAGATQNPGSRLENSSGEAPSHGEGLWPYLWRSWVLLWVWLGVGIVLYAAGPLLWVAKRSQDSTSLDVGSRAPMP